MNTPASLVRARSPYRTDEGPHVFYRRGPHWARLRRRGPVGPLARVPLTALPRMRCPLDGRLRALPPLAVSRLAARRDAPVGRTFLGRAAEVAGERTARAAAGFAAVATFHHAPGLLSAAFAQERLHRAASPDESGESGPARAEHLLDLGFKGWSDRVRWRRTAVATGRTGAVDRPGTTWRDRPAVDRGDGVHLVGDQVAAPGVLSEVSFSSALEAVSLALGHHPTRQFTH
ncbi:hypothetical protein [Kitasatospora purpeofusca]|uniref:hypothetical protein n=1 Tax=Kitasatospora purpeofusca TaxID=67352 RepID=UPI003812E5B5